MKKNLFPIILFQLHIIVSFAQTTVITGNIKDLKGENIAFIPITLKQVSDSTLLSYAYSNDAGNYELSFSGENEDLLITVSGLGIATQTKKIQNKSQTVNFIVTEEEIQLKEVVIKTQKITYNKDTLNYLVSAFSDDKDFAIGDVLKKMPGIDVTESGQIRYQGKAINKFYIENLDLLNGRYGIATQNIPAKDVSTVQVLEHHEPIKAMDSLRISDQAAINLKLKEGSKGTLNIITQLGIGCSPLLWDNELTVMYFAKKKQNISTYKGNNAGNDLTKELRSFNTSLDLLPAQVTNIQMPSPPDISQNRYLFNNSNAFTTNSLFGIGEDKELNLNVIYYNDYEKRASGAASSYFITGDSLLKINEIIQSATNTNRLETEIRYNENKEEKYVNNLLNLEGSWEDGKGNIWTGTTTEQRLHRPSLKIQNAFHLIKHSGNVGFEINSKTGFINSPQYLTILPGLYADLLNSGAEYSALRQDADVNTLISNNNFTLLSPFLIGKMVINPMFGFNLEMNSLHSELYPQDESGNSLTTIPDSMSNDLNKSQYKTYMGLTLNYKVGKFRLNAHLPVSYNLYQLRNKIYSIQDDNLNKFYFEPSLAIQYILSPKMEINASASFYHNMTGIYELYSGYLLQSYRNLNRYNSQFAASATNSQSLGIAYKDVVNMFFANATVSYNHTENSVIYTQSFKDNLLLTSFIKKPNERKTTFASSKISKGFDWMRVTSDLNLSYMSSSSQQIRQDNLVNYTNDFWNISGKLSAVPVSFLIVSYEGAWQESRSHTESQELLAPIRSFTQALNVDVTLFKKIRLGSHLEQYYNSALQSDKYLYFADLNLHYTWKQIRFELDWMNILNTKNYVTAYYSEMNEYHSNYGIRPSSLLLKVKFKLK
jgi:hypothetical protein